MFLMGIDYYLGIFERAGSLHRRNIKQNLDFSRVLRWKSHFNQFLIGTQDWKGSPALILQWDTRWKIHWLPFSSHSVMSSSPSTSKNFMICRTKLKSTTAVCLWRESEGTDSVTNVLHHLLETTVKTTICQCELKIHVIMSWICDGYRKKQVNLYLLLYRGQGNATLLTQSPKVTLGSSGKKPPFLLQVTISSERDY